MTLIRQLAVVIVALFVLLFAGTVTISVNDTRAYLNAQLKTISQDTATSLGMSLSPVMAANESAVVESMVNAVFDSGYYRQVTIRGIDGKPILERTAPVQVEGVPAWFVAMFPLQTPRGEALIMTGWQQAGTVSVAANPGQAYSTLWKHGVDSFWWFFAMLILTSALGMAALHLVLRPLRRVEAQAAAICDREYPVQEKLPRTLELRRVVVAMNRMTGKIKEIFDEQAKAMERLRSESHKDGLTGLANRRYFDMHVKQMIESNEDAQPGALLFIELKGFKGLNERMGYQAGDEALRETGRIIQQACQAHAGLDYFAARFGGANFAVALADVNESEALHIGERLAAALSGLYERGLADTQEVAHVGIALYRRHSYSQWLADADMALRAAQAKGANAVHLQQAQTGKMLAAYPATRWTALLRKVIEERDIMLHLQPALDATDRSTVLHYEALLRIAGEDGKPLAAGLFLPMARRLGLVHELDRLVVAEVLAGIAAGRYGGATVAVNLAASSVQDAGFADWLCAALQADPAAAACMAFEVSEYGALEDLDALRSLVLRIRSLGGRFGIDHFGRGFSSYGYLATLKIDYLKIDGRFIRGLAENRDNQFLVDSITKIAHGLDLKVIAESVETEQEWTMLNLLRADGVQGYGVAMPEAFADGSDEGISGKLA